MRKALIAFALVPVLVLAAGCEDTVTTAAPEDLAPPLGLRSLTGDGMVTLSWQASNFGEDREGFQVFQAPGSLSGTLEEIPAAFGTEPVATVTTSSSAGTFTADVDGLTNGTTYSFLVVAFKDDGDKISRPSNIVSDTPRRETPTPLQLVNGSGNARFVDVSADPIVASTSATGADILCQSFNAGAGDRHGMVGQNGARVQDLGFVQSWDQIDEAPLGGGSYPDASYSVQVLPNHVYAVFTGDGHYAKVWVTAVNSGNFGFTCLVAYQPQAGNNELKPGVGGF